MKSKPTLAMLLMGLTGALLGTAVGGTASAEQEQIVRMTARRFEFSPATIVVKKGQPVVLEITSYDFVHGFNVPDLKLRADLPPGKVTAVRFVPDRVGSFPFVCDNFCGAGHEEMHGSIEVKG
jgi:cytochrome c oxidase subunit 2